MRRAIGNDRTGAHWGYESANASDVTIKVGTRNRFAPVPEIAVSHDRSGSAGKRDVFTTEFGVTATPGR